MSSEARHSLQAQSDREAEEKVLKHFWPADGRPFDGRTVKGRAQSRLLERGCLRRTDVGEIEITPAGRETMDRIEKARDT